MKIEKLGLQLYTIRNTMGNADDIRESFKRIRDMGFTVGQTAGCAIPYEEYGRIAQEEGIEICGTHDDFGLMVNDTELAMANHRALGTTNMGIGGFHPADVAAVEAFIEKANALAEKIYPHGFKFTYHNHSHEFMKMENGKTTMEMLIEGLDPVKTSFVLDTYWVQHGGGDVRHWIEKLAGRIDILHLKDMGRNQNGPFITEVGNGNIWWEGVLETAAQAGIKHYVVEQDSWPGDPFDSVKMAADYLKKFM